METDKDSKNGIKNRKHFCIRLQIAYDRPLRRTLVLQPCYFAFISCIYVTGLVLKKTACILKYFRKDLFKI